MALRYVHYQRRTHPYLPSLIVTTLSIAYYLIISNLREYSDTTTKFWVHPCVYLSLHIVLCGLSVQYH
jgi:hypothetical protein